MAFGRRFNMDDPAYGLSLADLSLGKLPVVVMDPTTRDQPIFRLGPGNVPAERSDGLNEDRSRPV
jgi:hypothetical protein